MTAVPGPSAETVEPVVGAASPLASWKTLLLSFGTIAAGETVARLFGLATLLTLTHRLGPSGFGVVTLGTTLVILFALVADSGTEIVSLRDISRTPERFRQFAEPVLGLRLAMSVVAMVAFATTAELVGSGRDRVALLLFALLLPVIGLNLRWMVLALRQSRAIAAGNIVSQILFLTGVLLFVHGPGDVARVPAVQVVGELVYALTVLAVASRHCGRIRPRVDLAVWRRTLAEGLPLMLNQAARTAIGFFGLLTVAALLGHRQAGIYGAALKPILFLAVVTSMLFTSFLSSYSAASHEAAIELARRTMRTALAATIPIALVMTIAARPLVTTAFGSKFAAGAPVLAVLAWSVVAQAAGGAPSMALISAGRQRLLMKHNFTAAGVSIGANLAIVPLAGITGAAAVSLTTWVFLSFLNQRSCVRLELTPPARTILAIPRRRHAALES